MPHIGSPAHLALKSTPGFKGFCSQGTVALSTDQAKRLEQALDKLHEELGPHVGSQGCEDVSAYPKLFGIADKSANLVALLPPYLSGPVREVGSLTPGFRYSSVAIVRSQSNDRLSVESWCRPMCVISFDTQGTCERSLVCYDCSVFDFLDFSASYHKVSLVYFTYQSSFSWDPYQRTSMHMWPSLDAIMMFCLQNKIGLDGPQGLLHLKTINFKERDVNCSCPGHKGCQGCDGRGGSTQDNYRERKTKKRTFAELGGGCYHYQEPRSNPTSSSVSTPPASLSLLPDAGSVDASLTEGADAFAHDSDAFCASQIYLSDSQRY